MAIIENNSNTVFEDTISAIIEKNKLSHAYLIEIKNDHDMGQVMTFVKKILTADINNKEEQQQREKLIDNKSHPDFKYISTEAQWIKKEQIVELQLELSTKSLENNRRVYVIENAEKLNKSSANTLLKFLEEPVENIVGILVTKNKYQVLDTLVSRCQFLKTGSHENNNAKENNEKIIEFIEIIEDKKEKSIPYFNKLDPSIMNNRKELTDFLSNVLLLYNDILYIKMEMEVLNYPENIDKIKTWSSKNTSELLSKKILALNNTIEMLKYNTNIKLMMDKLSILMSGCDINV